MSWRNVCISKPSNLSLRDENLVVKQDDVEITVPLQDIATIMLEEVKTIITRKLLDSLCAYKIIVFTCDDKHMPSGIFMPLGGHCRQLKVLRTQINLSLPFKKRIWQSIVMQKIANQALNLKICQKNGYDTLLLVAKTIKSGDQENREGYAAKEYFKYLFGNNFTRDSSDWINSALNYGYAIIRGAIARSIVKYGFHPALGIHHKSELNNFNLADDFIEPLRPVVDLWAFQNDKGETELTKQDRHALYSILNVDVLLDNKQYSLLTAVDEMIKSFSNACDKNCPESLKLPVILPLKEHSYE